MRRAFLVLVVVVVSFSVLGMTGTAQAAGTLTYVGSRFVWGKGVVFVFEGSGFKNKELKGATLFVGSNEYKLSCSVNKDEGKVICVASGGLTQYAGETGLITLAGRVFSVIIPGRTLPVGNQTLSCPDGTQSGADVTFFTSEETNETYFVTGNSSSSVQQNAENMLGEYLLSIEEIGSLYCGEEPS